jgi:hypothetical protein
MIKMLLFMHHLPFHLMHCIILFLAHSCSCTLDHAEPKLEVQAEQAQGKDLTNLDLGSSQAPVYLTLCLSFIFLISCYDS